MWSMLDDRLRDDLRSGPQIRGVLLDVQRRVHDGEIPATVAVEEVWSCYVSNRSAGGAPTSS